MEITNQLRDECIQALRNQPQPVYLREANLVANTLDKDQRRVQWTLTTEDPALVYDWNTGRVVLEVLLMCGAEFEDQTPLLRDHNQYSVTAILGSVTEHPGRQRRIARLLGWLNFGELLDDTSESIWRRVAQGHLRRGSVGYDHSRKNYVTIPAGETQTVIGRSFTAPKDRDLRVVTKWRLREFSMVVIPVDARAQAKYQQPRGTQELPGQESLAELTAPNATSSNQQRSTEDGMKKFLAFLHAAGLNASIKSTEEALTWARSGNLSADQIT